MLRIQWRYRFLVSARPSRAAVPVPTAVWIDHPSRGLAAAGAGGAILGAKETSDEQAGGRFQPARSPPGLSSSPVTFRRPKIRPVFGAPAPDAREGGA